MFVLSPYVGVYKGLCKDVLLDVLDMVFFCGDITGLLVGFFVKSCAVCVWGGGGEVSVCVLVCESNCV